MTTVNDLQSAALNTLYGTTTLTDGMAAHRTAVGATNLGGLLWTFLQNEGATGSTVNDMAPDYWSRLVLSINLLFEDGGRKLWENGDFAIAG